MNDDRTIPFSDAVIRAAITHDPPAGAAGLVWRELRLSLAETPQRRRGLIAWPWTSALPAVPPSPTRRRLRGVAAMVVLALLVASSVAIVSLIGSLHRLPPPFGLAKPGIIAFDSGGDIVVSNADGSGLRQLTFGAAADVQPAFSPDGTKIAYQSLVESKDVVELFVMDVDGTHRTMIATKPARVDVSGLVDIEWWRLSWSPDSRSVSYTARVDGRPEIFVVRADGTGATMIGDPMLEGQDPAWSPDGSRIAFHGGRYDAERGIYLMSADGSGLRRLTRQPGVLESNTGSYYMPEWSPDGASIAYSVWSGEPAVQPKSQQIWIVDVKTGVERPISNAAQFNDYPAWSPDGSRLAYYSDRSGGRFVVVDPDGSNEIELAAPAGGRPVWSPDGRHVVGWAYDERLGVYSITVIDVADGTGVVVPPVGSSEVDRVRGIATWQRLAN
jgi:Tol biopolymer transport system component